MGRTEELQEFQLEYYLLECQGGEQEDEELAGKTFYGVEVLKRDPLSPIDTDCEKCTIANFSCNREIAELFLNKLARNTVTPITLPFIADDFLGS